MSSLLLTGATGLVGRYVLRQLLADGRRVTVLVRPGKLASARDRVEALLAECEAAERRALARPVVIEADIRQSDLGLSTSDVRWIAANCDEALHSAASMTFRASADGEPLRTNMEGTRHLLDACRRAGIRRFHHVSTAYLCGLRTGRVLETEFDLGQDLGNIYEKSKLEAERLVRDASWLEQYTIYRPASIVGDSRTGFTTSYHGYYLPLQLAYTMAGRIPPQEMGDRFFARLGLAGDERKNFVPVDWVAACIARLVTDRAAHGGVYHLSSPEPVSIRLMQRVTQDSIHRYSKRKVASKATEQDLAACERLFEHHMEIYRSHWRDDPTFDRTNISRVLPDLPCPRMDYARMLLMARFAIEHGFASPKHRPAVAGFDTRAWLAAATAIHGDNRSDANPVTLEVSGAGGGQWRIEVTDAGIAQADGQSESASAATVYLSSRVLEQLVAGKTNVAEAIERGKLVLEAPPELAGLVAAALERSVSGPPPAARPARKQRVTTARKRAAKPR